MGPGRYQEIENTTRDLVVECHRAWMREFEANGRTAPTKDSVRAIADRFAKQIVALVAPLPSSQHLAATANVAVAALIGLMTVDEMHMEAMKR